MLVINLVTLHPTEPILASSIVKTETSNRLKKSEHISSSLGASLCNAGLI